MVFHLAERGGRLTGTMDSPDQGATGIRIDEARAAGGSLRLRVGGVKGSYTGKTSKDGHSVTGTWRQGVSAPLALKRTGGAGAAPAGDWAGKLNSGGAGLRLVFHLKPASGGKVTAPWTAPTRAPWASRWTR